MLAGAIISLLHLSGTNTQREFRVAKGIKLLLQNLLQFQKQSEARSDWNDDLFIEDSTDFRMILMLKPMVMARMTAGWGVVADQWRPRQIAVMIWSNLLLWADCAAPRSLSSQLPFLLQSLKRNLQKQCRN